MKPVEKSIAFVDLDSVEREKQRGLRRWRWQSILGAAVASMSGGGGDVVLRVIESEGLFEILVIDLSLVVRVS